VQFGLNVFFWERAAAESIICWLYKFPFSWNYLRVSRSRNLFSLKTSLGSIAGFSFCIQCYLGTAVVPCLRQPSCGKQKAYVWICVAFYDQQESYICELCRRLQCVLQVYQPTFFLLLRSLSRTELSFALMYLYFCDARLIFLSYIFGANWEEPTQWRKFPIPECSEGKWVIYIS